MNEPAPRFAPRPRRDPVDRGHSDLENFRAELVAVLRRTEAVIASDPDGFTEGSQVYDVASMAVIRLAALLERPEYAEFVTPLTRDEVAAIRTTRNITAHAGYGGMNDDLFFTAVTVRIPAIIRRLLG